ncbi:MAG: tetratricopeptide repeat protein [Pirellulaceae bacterium]|nr:tetratricopeptide repeat protein [Pirellulaceae bacterium]
MFRAYCTTSILSICMFALLIPCAVAQDAQHRVLYGQGVHAYYNGDYESAVRYLTATISKDTDDPRSYYFRGLANAKLGNDEASLADLKKGAAIEALDDRGVYKISTALQRIQGQPRLQIEKLRKQARLELVAAEKVRLQARYEQQQSDEAVALRKPAAPSIPTDAETTIRQSNPFAPSNIAGVKSNPANVTSSKSNTIPGVDDKDPLANVQGNTPTPMPTPVPANPTPPAGNNPFAAGNKPVPANPTPPVGNNPFAPGNKPMPANPTPPAGNNPFAPGNTPAPAANPAAPQAGGGGGTLGSIFRSLNPFGGGSPEPNAEPNAESPLDQLKNLIPGLGSAPGAAPAPPAPPIPAPGGNPFK